MPNDLKKQKFNLFGKKDVCPGEEDLAAYMDNRLSAREMAEVQAHLNHCPLCRAVLATTLESSQASSNEAPPKDWMEQAQALVPEDTRPFSSPKSTGSIFQRISRFLTLPRLAPVAVTAAAVVMISFYWVNYQPGHMLLTQKTQQAPLNETPTTEQAATETRQTDAEPSRLPAPKMAAKSKMEAAQPIKPAPKMAAQAPAKTQEPVLSEPVPPKPAPKRIQRAARAKQNKNAAPMTETAPEMAAPAGASGQLRSKPAPEKAPQKQIQRLAQATKIKEAAPMDAAGPSQIRGMVQRRVFKLVQVSGEVNHNHVTWLVSHEMAKVQDCLFKAKTRNPSKQHLFKTEFIWQENRIAVSDLSPNQYMAACLVSILNQGDLIRPEGKGKSFSLILTLTSP
ncbi:zf-HC2 domain-containing protein [Dethiosulfatarculus sandiegensis]|uniref:Putative zinc-finger domain-containing protein n=1 Tax=Dethiosulfatarculus sandiegensis TaxID=1429043 RepID=A0A0D2J6E3_9BACT|nr:zf-HC2 domain-containing protein [Dethiosulfatarculus sandiegensis]KIX11261.1 hypothetical protein X474_26105 [Dethiosulfatarculus sandiegensis]